MKSFQYARVVTEQTQLEKKSIDTIKQKVLSQYTSSGKPATVDI